MGVALSALGSSKGKGVGKPKLPLEIHPNLMYNVGESGKKW